MKLPRFLITAVISLSSILPTIPVQARELAPKIVVDAVYQGVQHIHGYQSTPRLIWGVSKRNRGACGRVSGSHYCSRNHTIYILQDDINMAYKYGDAALAYIIAHEYAHAMQTAFGFRPGATTITELQADCLAGFYLGKLPNITFDERDLQEILNLAYHIGDYQWWNENHHGTPKERYNAVLRGITGAVNQEDASACRI
jgi:predicted metalloprotease